MEGFVSCTESSKALTKQQQQQQEQQKKIVSSFVVHIIITLICVCVYVYTHLWGGLIINYNDQIFIYKYICLCSR